MLTLFTFYIDSELRIIDSATSSQRRTCPPGPELREYVNSTLLFGIARALNWSIQALASALCAAFSSDGRAGGTGKPWICWLECIRLGAANEARAEHARRVGL